MNISAVRAGFSLIELLVVISIFSIISLVILANHSQFQSTVLLESLAYDIGLSVRQAQVYGLSVRRSTGADEFQSGYGVHFDSDVPTQYLFFADVNNDKRYVQGVDQIVETYTLGRGHTVKRFCAETAAGISDCSDSGIPVQDLDVTFFRPEPDANFMTSAGSVYSRAQIVVSSASGSTRTVTIASTGQISVTNP